MSSSRNTLVRSLHDLGGAAWFGGSLMGVVALNGATGDIEDPTQRAKIAADGWARWSPAVALAIGAHLVGGVGLSLVHRNRIRNQAGVGANTVAKTALTAAALATTAYSGALGAKIAKAGDTHTQSGTKPSEHTPPDVAKAQRQLQVLQWATPVLTGALVVLGALHGEQQRPTELLRGLGKQATRRGSDLLPS